MSRGPQRGKRLVAALRRVLWPGLAFLLLTAVVLNLGIGAVAVSPARVLGILAGHLGVDTGIDYTTVEDSVVWAIRLPRVVIAALAGAGLAVAGAGLQGVFRNPLADPQLVGVSSGAALGAVVGIVAGASFGSIPVAGAAALGAFGAALAVARIARFQGQTEVATLILTGVAVSALVGAVVGFLSAGRFVDGLPTSSFWLLGGLSATTWRSVLGAAPWIAAGVVVIPFYARPLNLTLLGEAEARHLGVDVSRVRMAVLAFGSLAIGGAVAATGIIGFVGLLAPHAIRAVAGPDHRIVIPAAGVLGAVLLLLADLLARSVASPIEIPVGFLTAILGGPLFLWLLRRTRAEYGAWG